jgi:hypothetical protein
VAGNAVVLTVVLLGWVMLWLYLMRLERRVRELEKR